MEDVKWKKADWEVTKENFHMIESIIGYEFPQEYKEFILKQQPIRLSTEFINKSKKQNGYSPRDFFKETEDISCLNTFVNLNDVETFIETYYYGFTQYPENFCKENNIQEQDTYNFPKEIVLFADDGGWDFAFDFRGGRKEGKIPVVWIVYDGDVDRRIRYFTDSFEDFLECLGNPEKDVVDEYIKG
jgi:SMI1 / KNR4 family.